MLFAELPLPVGPREAGSPTSIGPSDAERQRNASFSEDLCDTTIATSVAHVDRAISSGIVNEDTVPLFTRLDDAREVPQAEPVLADGEEYLSEELGRKRIDLAVAIPPRTHRRRQRV